MQQKTVVLFRVAARGSRRKPEYADMRTFRFSIATILLLVISSSAHAMAVTWTFQNALFNDNASLTGSFDFNADIGGAAGFSNLDLVTSDGDLVGAGYTGSALSGSSDVFFYTISGAQILAVTLMEAMTNLGGTIDIAPYFISGELGWLPNFDVRFLTEGFITTTPNLSGPGGDTVQLAEPAILAVFVIGLMAIGALRLRRRANI